MAHTENTLKDFKKENLISLVLSLQKGRDKVIDTLGQLIDNLTSTVDNLSSKLAQVESSVVVTKTFNNELLKHANSLERDLHRQEQYSRRECLKIVGIPLPSPTVCSILGNIDVSLRLKRY